MSSLLTPSLLVEKREGCILEAATEVSGDFRYAGHGINAL